MEFFGIDPPSDTLYRIQYEGCATTYSPHSGLTAKDTSTFYTDCDDIYIDFGGAVEDHLCWRKHYDSPFISVFGNKQHAENWALDWSKRHHDKICQVFEIKASKLVRSYIFSAHEIRENLPLQVSEKAEASIKDEYLICYRIPAQAIAGYRDTEDIKQGTSLFFLKIRDMSTNSPAERDRLIISTIAPRPEDFASKELVDALDALRI